MLHFLLFSKLLQKGGSLQKFVNKLFNKIAHICKKEHFYNLSCNKKISFLQQVRNIKLLKRPHPNVFKRSLWLPFPCSDN